MPQLKRVPKEMKDGKKRERRRMQRKWVEKNWKWAAPACAVAIVGLVLVIIGIVSFIQKRHTVRILKKCVGSEVSTDMTELAITSKCENPRTLDFRSFKKLRRLSIGSICFREVRKVKFGGLKYLETIEIGNVNGTSYNFNWASLELKSILIHSE